MDLVSTSAWGIPRSGVLSGDGLRRDVVVVVLDDIRFPTARKSVVIKVSPTIVGIAIAMPAMPVGA